MQGNVPANTRLGIPALTLNDGPQGFRGNDPGTSTCWPSGLTMAASWDVNAMYQFGEAMGQEFAQKGAASLTLSPSCCVACVCCRSLVVVWWWWRWWVER
jgi:beta-glucosidase